MKLYGISNGMLSTLKARLVEIEDKKHYNLIIGTRGCGGWEYRVSVSDEMITNQFKDEYLLLDKDYSIRPVHVNGEHVTDKRNNKMYVLSFPTKPTLDKNILVVLYYKAEHNYKGNGVEELGTGIEIVGRDAYNAGLFLFKNNSSIIFYGDDDVMYNVQNKDGALIMTKSS